MSGEGARYGFYFLKVYKVDKDILIPNSIVIHSQNCPKSVQVIEIQEVESSNTCQMGKPADQA